MTSINREWLGKNYDVSRPTRYLFEDLSQEASTKKWLGKEDDHANCNSHDA